MASASISCLGLPHWVRQTSDGDGDGDAGAAALMTGTGYVQSRPLSAFELVRVVTVRALELDTGVPPLCVGATSLHQAIAEVHSGLCNTRYRIGRWVCGVRVDIPLHTLLQPSLRYVTTW